MTKYQYLVDRYSQSLTKYDIKNLFRRLIKIKGSVAAATKAANIKRKTYYDWEDNGEDVKPATKRKVLDACLSSDPFGTIDFLINKDELDYNELLQRQISMICDQIDDETDPAELSKWNTILEKFIKSHTGAIQDLKTVSLADMLNSVNLKAKALGVEEIAKDVSLIQPNLLSEKFVDLLDIFRNKSTMSCIEIVNALGLPEEFVNRACRIYGYTPALYSTEATQEKYILASSASLHRIIEPEKPTAELQLEYIAARRR
ncbi:MAG: hypothetical protein ABSC91_11110 [Candidatus Bathyarchaeia archaeon]|jgi:hypothetical protein